MTTAQISTAGTGSNAVAKSINERFLDHQVAWQIRWIKLGNKEVETAVEILNRIDGKLAALLHENGLDGAPYTKARAEALRKQVASIVNSIHDDYLRPELLQTIEDVAVMSSQVEGEAFEQIMPAGLDITTPNLGVLQQAATLNPFNGAVMADWVSQLKKNDLDRTWKTILDGIISGTTTEELIRNLVGSPALNYKDGVRHVSRRGLEALVRTSINHAANQGRQMFWEANEGLLKGVRWVSTLDTRTTPICQYRDGRVGPVMLDPDWTPPEGSEPLDPPMARPPAHPNCRSTTVAITKSWRELGFDIDELPPGTRASMNGQVPDNLTYYDWLKGQSDEIVEEVLGPERFAMWKSGEVDAFQKFYNDAGQKYTLDDLRAKLKMPPVVNPVTGTAPSTFTLAEKNGKFGSWTFEKGDVIENPVPSWYGLNFYDAVGKKRFTQAWDNAFVEMELDPAKLTTIQSQIEKAPEVIPDYTKIPPIKVAKLDGNYIILDGNHRAATLWIQGARRIKANVIDLDDPKNAKLINRDKLGKVDPPKLPVVDEGDVVSSPEFVTMAEMEEVYEGNYLMVLNQGDLRDIEKMNPALFGVRDLSAVVRQKGIPEWQARQNLVRLWQANNVTPDSPGQFEAFIRQLIKRGNLDPGLLVEPEKYFRGGREIEVKAIGNAKAGKLTLFRGDDLTADETLQILATDDISVITDLDLKITGSIDLRILKKLDEKGILNKESTKEILRTIVAINRSGVPDSAAEDIDSMLRQRLSQRASWRQPEGTTWKDDEAIIPPEATSKILDVLTPDNVIKYVNPKSFGLDSYADLSIALTVDPNGALDAFKKLGASVGNRFKSNYYRRAIENIASSGSMKIPLDVIEDNWSIDWFSDPSAPHRALLLKTDPPLKFHMIETIEEAGLTSKFSTAIESLAKSQGKSDVVFKEVLEEIGVITRTVKGAYEGGTRSYKGAKFDTFAETPKAPRSKPPGEFPELFQGPDVWDDPREVDAMRYYQGSSFSTMNGALRMGERPQGNAGINTDILDRAFEKSFVAQDLTVMRGSRNAKEVLGVVDLNQVKAGHRYRDLGYHSTTTSTGIGKSFGGGGKDSLLVTIKLPKGFPALPVSKYTDYRENEMELLLPRGIEFEVESIMWDEFLNYWVATVKAVGID